MMQVQKTFSRWLTFSITGVSVAVPLLLIFLALMQLFVLRAEVGVDAAAIDSWKPFRDLAYGYYAILCVVMGMVQFVTKRKSASIIYSSVVGLVLTTFSFVIASIIFDVVLIAESIIMMV